MSDKADFKRIEKYQKAIDADRKAGLAHWQIAQKYGVDLLGTLSVRTRNCLWAQDIYNEWALRSFMRHNGGDAALESIPNMGAGLAKEVLEAIATKRDAERAHREFDRQVRTYHAHNLRDAGLHSMADVKAFVEKNGLVELRKLVPTLGASGVRVIAKELGIDSPGKRPPAPTPTPEVAAAIALLKSSGYTVSRKKPKAD